jgi:hypothetical protein
MLRQTGMFVCGLLVILAITSCHAMMQVEQSPELLRAGIKAGEILEVGDEVNITTRDGVSHRFVIKGITDDQILGPLGALDIDEIDAVERLEVSGWRTTLVVILPPILFILAVGYALAGAFG